MFIEHNSRKIVRANRDTIEFNKLFYTNDDIKKESNETKPPDSSTIEMSNRRSKKVDKDPRDPREDFQRQMSKKEKKKLICELFDFKYDFDIEKAFVSGELSYTEKPNDLEYLYMVSYLLRTKINKLDKKESLDQNHTLLRENLLEKNTDVNNYIREISLRYFQKGTYNINVKDMLNGYTNSQNPN